MILVMQGRYGEISLYNHHNFHTVYILRLLSLPLLLYIYKSMRMPQAENLNDSATDLALLDSPILSKVDLAHDSPRHGLGDKFRTTIDYM